VRGFSAPSLIVIDEAARLPDLGDLMLLSTPFGGERILLEGVDTRRGSLDASAGTGDKLPAYFGISAGRRADSTVCGVVCAGIYVLVCWARESGASDGMAYGGSGCGTGRAGAAIQDEGGYALSYL